LGPTIPLSGESNGTLSLGKTSLHPSLLFRLRKHATITYYPHTQKHAMVLIGAVMLEVVLQTSK